LERRDLMAGIANDDFLAVHQGERLHFTIGTQPSWVLSANDGNGVNKLKPLSLGSVTSGPSNGNLSRVGPYGGITYKPNAGFVGQDYFTYQISDKAGNTGTALVTIDVTNTAPTTVDDSYSVTHDRALVVDRENGLLANDSDPDGDRLTAQFDAGPSNGTLKYLRPNGSFKYVPNAGYVGSDSFTYKVFDGAQYATAEVNISVGNVAPIANADIINLTAADLVFVNVTNPIRVNVIANDTDADGDSLRVVSMERPEGASHFRWRRNGAVEFVPAADWEGINTLSYTITDGAAESTSTLTIRDTSRIAVNVSLAYGDTFGVSDDDLVQQTTAGEFIYAPKIPFEVAVSLGDSVLSSRELQVYVHVPANSAGALIFSQLLMPGDVFNEVFEVSPELAGSVAVSALVVDPFLADPPVEDKKEEPIIKLSFTFNDATREFELRPQHVKDWIATPASTRANDVVRSVFTNERIDTFANEMFAVDGTLTVLQHRATAEGRISQIETYIGDRIEDIVGESVDVMLATLDHPKWTIRYGVKNEAARQVKRLIDNIPSAVEGGMLASIPEGKSLADAVGEFVTYEFASAADIRNAAIPQGVWGSLETFVRTGANPLGDIFNVDKWRAFPIVKKVGIQVPLKFGEGDTFDGFVFLGAKDLSYESFLGNAGRLAIEGDVHLVRPVRVGRIDVQLFKVNGMMEREIATGTESYSVGIGIGTRQ
jgi:hypothetical protein